MGKDDAGLARNVVKFEMFQQPEHWKSDMLPVPMRRSGGHGSSHPFLTPTSTKPSP